MGFQTLARQLHLFSFFLAASLVRAQGDGAVGAGPLPEPTSHFPCPSYIYAFGDSFTDTGNLQAIIPTSELKYPYGESYCFPARPKERTRYSNGRLIIDFISSFEPPAEVSTPCVCIDNFEPSRNNFKLVCSAI